MQRHYEVAITTNTMAAAIWYLLRSSVPSKLTSSAAVSTTFLVQLASNFLVIWAALIVVICKIPISIPLTIETSMHQYFEKRYSVRCWYRCTVQLNRNKSKYKLFSFRYERK